MKKKIFIAIGVLLVIVVAGLTVLNFRNRTLSPSGEASGANNGLQVDITYSRPSVRERLIFGTEAAGALQPFGKYWRLGANEATEATFNRDVTLAGNPVKAGTYKIYAIPGEQTFQIILNTKLGEWGAMEPDHEKDILKFEVPVEKIAPVEQFTISVPQKDSGLDIVFEWSDVRFVVPVR